ncbi:FHA domain-containing protein [Variovorax rhizosphaerae]|uniref:FHA domain-containing protein n=1 Tax=Variovorax rhizosphaerae TaxID=1836200 RepID=A0ABU8WYV6_9BURK
MDSVSASRKHALTTVAPAFVTIEDIGSSNGTCLNGERVQSQVFTDGDAVRVGTFEMDFVADTQEFPRGGGLRLRTVPGLLVDVDRGSPSIRDAPRGRRGKP